MTIPNPASAPRLSLSLAITRLIASCNEAGAGVGVGGTGVGVAVSVGVGARVEVIPSVKDNLAWESAGVVVTVRAFPVGPDATEVGILVGWESGPPKKAMMPTRPKARIIKGKLLEKERRVEVRARLRAFLQDCF